MLSITVKDALFRSLCINKGDPYDIRSHVQNALKDIKTANQTFLR